MDIDRITEQPVSTPTIDKLFYPYTGSPEHQYIEGDPLGTLLTYLREQPIITGKMVLIPLKPDRFSVGSVAFSLFKGWTNKDLRHGYLPELPTTFDDIMAVVWKWANDPITIVYLFSLLDLEFDSTYSSNTGYLKSVFCKVPCSQEDPSGVEPRISVKIHLSGGNVKPNLQGMGLTTFALAMAIESLQDIACAFGVDIRSFCTQVSVRNSRSIAVLHNNGFTVPSIDESQLPDSPIVMGGKNYPMVRPGRTCFN